MLKKVLIHEEDDGQIHYEVQSSKTLCGKRLHPISSVYTPKLGVTCSECIKLHDSKKD